MRYENGQPWALKLKSLLETINCKVNGAAGA
jgi:hypothetical protein